MNSKPYNIVLLPDENLAHESIKLSKQLAQKFDTRFILDNKQYYAHETLYMLQINDQNLPKVLIELKKIAGKFSPFVANPIGYAGSKGFIGIDHEITEELFRLHVLVLQTINQYRDGLRKADVQRYDSYSPEVKKLIDTYGFQSALELWQPHITLSRLKNSEEALSLHAISTPAEMFKGYFSNLGIFVMGPDGTCIEPIATFPLGKKS